MDYLITSWRGMSEKASMLAAETVDLPSLANGIQAVALDAVSREQLPLLSLGTYYVGAHNKKGFQDTNLLVLEWDEAKRDDVRQRLRWLGLRCVLQDTYCAEDDTLCVSAIIPLDRKITDHKEYYRLASLITDDIGIGEMSNCWGATFIAIVNPEGDSEDIDGSPLEIDHRLEEGGFVKTANYLRRALWQD